MLSDEDMKAIEDLKDMIGKSKDLMEEEFYKLATIHNIQAVATILNLIEKQSKEIEELKNEVMKKELIIDGMKEDRRIAVEEIQEQYFISKEESEQKERKAYIKGTNDADKLCNKKWEDKIKAKIEEIDEVLKGQLIEKIRVYFEAQKEVLESLLEKE